MAKQGLTVNDHGQLVDQGVQIIMRDGAERFLTAALRAVYAYKDSADVSALVDFAEDAAVTVSLHGSGAFRKALAESDDAPRRAGRDLQEIFAAHRP